MNTLAQLTVEMVLSAGVTGLTAAVVTLFGLGVHGYKRVCKKLDECEKDRDKLWHAIGKERHHG